MKKNEPNPNVIEFPPNHILFRQGSKGGDLFFLKKGTVELTVRDSDSGEEGVVAIVSEPAVLGTMTFLEGEPRSASARCVTDVHVVLVNQIQREKLLSEVPQWFKVLLKDLSSNLRNLNEEYVKVKGKYEVLEKRFALLKAKTEETESDDAKKKAKK